MSKNNADTSEEPSPKIFYIMDDSDGGSEKSHPLSFDSSREVSEVDEAMDDQRSHTVTIGICAMHKKSHSKPMKQILNRLQQFEYIETLVFEESMIINNPIEEWPIVTCLISFYSSGFPLQKAIQYAQLRQPLVLNDLEMQKILFDRRLIYQRLEEENIPVPRYVVLDRDAVDYDDSQLVEDDDFIIVNGVTFHKPFVEKPINAEDHNICIYFPSSAGGGSQKLFRKIGDLSSRYSSHNRVRRAGSYIYEDFKPTDGCDVKVYAVGPDYAHAEARKAPGLDGKVERDTHGKEVRYPVLLGHYEKYIARTVCLLFNQTVCGFDLLRSNGKSYVCDVNGFSFVKNSSKYYDDCAKILGTMCLRQSLRQCPPDFNIPLHVAVMNEEIPMVPTTRGTIMELRCVIAVIRHGDRQPKQKLKMEVYHKKFFELFESYGGCLNSSAQHKIKLKRPSELQAVLDASRDIINESKYSSNVRENISKLEQLRMVLEMYGYFSGINRKVQMKYLISSRSKTSSSEDGRRNGEMGNRLPSILLICKWGGELTPLGRVHGEALGKAFRCMYPGGAMEDEDGSGLLRLHSTFRHDLKIYASDEGRVQMTAAAFAKGLLALEGELTPIMVHMVKCAKIDGLLDHDESHSTISQQEEVKERLHKLLSADRNFTTDDFEQLAPTGVQSLKNSLACIGNPVEMCNRVYSLIQKIVSVIRDLTVSDDAIEVELYNGETLDMMFRRWSKLEKDFKPKNGGYDISKIPDIYDCIKYDTLHNASLNLPMQTELYKCSKALADVVVPQEYGITKDEKLMIAKRICSPLLRKIKTDLERNMDEASCRLNPNEYSTNEYTEDILSPNRHVRTRLYFTSESHIHSLLNIIRYGGLFDPSDEQWQEADKYLGAVTELNYLSQLVFHLYEDPTKDIDSEDKFKVEFHISPGIRYWEETASYESGTFFIPRTPKDIHDVNANQQLRKSSFHTDSLEADNKRPHSVESPLRSVASQNNVGGKTRTYSFSDKKETSHDKKKSSKTRSSPSVKLKSSERMKGRDNFSVSTHPKKVHSTSNVRGVSPHRQSRHERIKNRNSSPLSSRKYLPPYDFASILNEASNSAPNLPSLSDLYQDKVTYQEQNILPTAVKASRLLQSFCTLKTLHNNLNVRQLEDFLKRSSSSVNSISSAPTATQEANPSPSSSNTYNTSLHIKLSNSS